MEQSVSCPRASRDAPLIPSWWGLQTPGAAPGWEYQKNPQTLETRQSLGRHSLLGGLEEGKTPHLVGAKTPPV